MKRLFWVGIGVAVTIVVARQVSKLNHHVDGVARAVSPAGIAQSLGNVAASVTSMAAQLRESMAENEEALRQALLPDEQTLAAARETRARRQGRHAAPDPDLDDIFDDENIDYF